MTRPEIPAYKKARRRSGNRRGEDPKHVTAVAEQLGIAIRVARLNRGLTQEDLAMMSGCAGSTMGQYERGDKTPSTVAMLRIAKACQTSISSIYATLDTYKLPTLPSIPDDAKKPLPLRKWK